MLVLSSADFFQFIFFKNYFQEHSQSDKRFGPTPAPTSSSQVIKLFILYSAERKIYPAHKC